VLRDGHKTTLPAHQHPVPLCHQAGYLPKDHDEMNAVERADNDSGEIEIFIPSNSANYHGLFDAVQERGAWRDRRR